MAIGFGVACPKGKTKKALKAKRDRADAQQLKAMQDAVWKRECDKLPFMSLDGAKCQDCGKWVYRDAFDAWCRGHVHHVVSRRHKATRYSVRNGRLLCRACHNRTHGREF